MGRILSGIIFCLVLAPLAVLAWFKFGHPPVAVDDKPFPYERQIVQIPMEARIDREMVKIQPMSADESLLVAGAQIYRQQCASCHGLHGKPSAFGSEMYPMAPPLWEAHHDGKVVGVSDDPPGETYWKISNGIRLSGMPAYKRILTDTQIWQVTLLLANADKPLPPEAVAILRGDQQPQQTVNLAPSKPAKGK